MAAEVAMSWMRLLDDLLSEHVRSLGQPIARAQLQHVHGAQMPEGGFRGRQGQSDLYYTDFALRILAWLEPDSPAVSRAAVFVSGIRPPPRDVVECFCLLNCARLLAQCGEQLELDAHSVAGCLLAHALPEGGSAARSGTLSAYHTFIAALAWQLLGRPLPQLQAARNAIEALHCADGGFSERPGHSVGQTNATAATVAFLMLSGGLNETQAAGATEFISSMQAQDGGLRAHAQSPESDLLSTFTGLLTLKSLGAVGAADLPAIGRFVRAVALADGGFASCTSDPSADVEYTYYGLGCMALLRAAMTVTP